MPPQIRAEQAQALGGAVACQPPTSALASAFETVPPPEAALVKSVIIVDPTKIDTFITIELVDDETKPVPFENFVVTPPGMQPVKGKLDANGKARIEGINAGTCTVEFPDIDRRDFK